MILTSGVWKDSGQGKRHRHVRDAGDGRQTRGQHKLGLKTRRRQHRVKQNGAVRRVAVSVRQRRVGVGKFAQRQFGERRPGLADGFGDKIADGLHRFDPAFRLRGQLPRQFRRLRGLARPVQHRLVQFLEVIRRIADKIAHAGGINPFRRKLGFGRQRRDLSRLPLKLLLAAIAGLPGSSMMPGAPLTSR